MLVAATLIFLGACRAEAIMPRPDHVVVVIEENTDFAELLATRNIPFLRSLIENQHRAVHTTLFTDSYGIGHPSQPNYFALFAGDTYGIKDNAPPPRLFPEENLATELARKHLRFRAYSQSRSRGHWWPYARRHNPWVYFKNSAPYQFDTKDFPRDPTGFAKLPTVSFVVPDDYHDMHSGPKSVADRWLRDLLGPYLAWAATHNSLLIVTWDECDRGGSDQPIPTLFVGPMVKPGADAERINHYSVLRTIEDFYDLPPLGRAAAAHPIRHAWISQSSSVKKVLDSP